MELIRRAAEGLPWSTLARVDRSSLTMLGGIKLAVAPVYRSETTPPQIRTTGICAPAGIILNEK